MGLFDWLLGDRSEEWYQKEMAKLIEKYKQARIEMNVFGTTGIGDKAIKEEIKIRYLIIRTANDMKSLNYEQPSNYPFKWR